MIIRKGEEDIKDIKENEKRVEAEAGNKSRSVFNNFTSTSGAHSGINKGDEYPKSMIHATHTRPQIKRSRETGEMDDEKKGCICGKNKRATESRQRTHTQ